MTSSFTSMLLTALLALLGDDDADRRGARRRGRAGARRPRPRRRRSSSGSPERIVYLGSGPLTGLARESALKMLEITAGRVDTYFDSALGFRHGPKAVLDDRTLVVVYGSNDAVHAAVRRRHRRGSCAEAIGDDAC